MMSLKTNASLCLLLFSLAVQAQNICTGIAPAGPASFTEAAPTWAALPCIPDAIGGTGKGYNLRVSAAGVVPWVWCPSGTGWALRWGALTWEDAAPIAAGLPAALLATDKRQAIADLAFPHMGKDIASPELKALWCPHWAAMKASMPAAEVWVVAPATSTASPAGTRPTYRYTAPATIALDGGRAAQGSACSCTITRFVSGSSTYCSVQSLPAKVAVCVKR